MPWPKGKPHDPQTKAKIAAAQIGRKHSEETKERMAAWHRGRPRDPETVEKIRQARLEEGRTLTGEARTKRFASFGMKGKTHSPEARAKISAAKKGIAQPKGAESKLRGRKFSPETIARMRTAARARTTPHPMKGRQHSEETKAKLRGRTYGEETKAKLRARTYSPETRAKMSAAAVRRYALQRAIGQVKATAPERKVAALLTAGGHNFIEQHPLGKCVVDYYLPDENIVIEVQGCFWHGCKACGHGDRHPEQQARDKRKATYLRSQGYGLVTLWEHDLR